MPVFPAKDAPVAGLCTLKQAMMWMWREEVPIDHSRWPQSAHPQPSIAPNTCPREFAELLQAWCDSDGPLPLYGRPSIGAPINQRDPFGNYRGFKFGEFGDHVQIPMEDLLMASAEDFNIDRSNLSHVVSGSTRRSGVMVQGGVTAAWGYIDLFMVTADLLDRFPSSKGRVIVAPEVKDRPGPASVSDDVNDDCRSPPNDDGGADTKPDIPRQEIEAYLRSLKAEKGAAPAKRKAETSARVAFPQYRVTRAAVEGAHARLYGKLPPGKRAGPA